MKKIKELVSKKGKAILLLALFGAGLFLTSCGSGGSMITHKSCQATKAGNHR